METCIDCNVENRIMTIKGNIGMQSLECAVQCIVDEMYTITELQTKKMIMS